MRNTCTRPVLVALALAALAVGTATPAGAATVAPADLGGSHCVRDAGSDVRHCFADFTAAIAYASGGEITDAPADPADAVSDEGFQAELVALSDRATARAATATAVSFTAQEADDDTSVIAATLFTGTNFSGESETIRQPSPCVKDGWYDYYVTLGTAMSGKVESVEPWANCWIWLHEGDSWDSARQGPYKEDTADLGEWKDRAVLMGLS